MNFQIAQLSLAEAAQVKTDALVVLVSESFKPGQDPLSVLIAQALKAKDLQPQAGQMLAAYRVTGVWASKIWLLGVGEGSAAQIKTAFSGILPSIKTPQFKNITILATSDLELVAIQALALTISEGTYVYTTTAPQAKPRQLQNVRLGLPRIQPAHHEAQAITSALILGVEEAKEWGNRPANLATPSALAMAAKNICKAAQFTCEILGPKEVSRIGMGSFLAVAQGSSQPLRFIVMRYQGAAKSSAPVVLVGKGITFDTGGISIKPAAEMDEMKFDMCGAASVLGVFKSLGVLKPAINVVGLIPACENMPDGQAIKPGDVVTSMSGQTIEILNTDAEGRLILCDALTYAERFKPRAVIDIATLTGACVIALGAVRSGLFTSDEEMALALHQAGESSGDLCWRMPLDDAYAEGLKSHFADVANVAGRAGGSISAAKFLQRFAKSFPWAHLDIAGTAWRSGAAKGATGRPVGLLLHYLMSQARADQKVRKPGVRSKTRS